MSGNLTSPPGVTPPAARPQVPGEGAVSRAWISLAFYALSFFASFAVGEGLLGVYGYEDTENAPFWPTFGAVAPAILVFSVPGVFAVYFGRKALRQGNRAGLLPAIIGVIVALAWILLNLLGELAS